MRGTLGSELKTLSVQNTGMAVTTDIGNTKDIHPRNKQEVGRRLALWALAKNYGKELVHWGPFMNPVRSKETISASVSNMRVGGLRRRKESR